jgi:hypothetical protein
VIRIVYYCDVSVTDNKRMKSNRIICCQSQYGIVVLKSTIGPHHFICGSRPAAVFDEPTLEGVRIDISCPLKAIKTRYRRSEKAS